MVGVVAPGYRLRLLLYYWRRVLAYGFTVSLLGGIALTAVGLATTDVAALTIDQMTSNLVAGVTVVPLLLAAVGHWPGVLLYRLFHGSEMPLFLNGGWGPNRLAFASWALTVATGGLLSTLVLLVW